jgi:murein L,D-transpeptidase YafK
MKATARRPKASIDHARADESAINYYLSIQHRLPNAYDKANDRSGSPS